MDKGVRIEDSGTRKNERGAKYRGVAAPRKKTQRAMWRVEKGSCEEIFFRTKRDLVRCNGRKKKIDRRRGTPDEGRARGEERASSSGF